MNNKAKILILGKLPPPFYGPAIATKILLQSRLGEHFNLMHLATNINDQIEDIATLRIGKVVKSVKLYAKFIKILSNDIPDIILVPISQSTIGFIKDSIFILLSRMYRKKAIIHLRGGNFSNWLNQSSFLTRSFARYALQKSAGVIVLGKGLRYQFENIIPAEKIHVVPNGADYPIQSNPIRDVKRIRLLFLSNLQSSKGITDFCDSLIILKKSNKPFIADIVGAWRTDETRAYCEKCVRDHLLPVTFHLPADFKKKYELYAAVDLFVFPPRMPEGHPWVIIEAMAAGLPIISTDQGAITESVIDGVNGYIVEKQNPEKIAKKIIFLLEHPDVRIQMAQASRRIYSENFTENNMVQNLKKVFETVLAQ